MMITWEFRPCGTTIAFVLGGRTLLVRSWPMNPHKETITASQTRLSIFFELSPDSYCNRVIDQWSTPVSACFSHPNTSPRPHADCSGQSSGINPSPCFCSSPSHLPRLRSSPPSLALQHGPRYSGCHPLHNQLREWPSQHHPRPRR